MVVAIFDNPAEGLPRLNSDEILRFYDERKDVVRELSVGNQLWQDDDLNQFVEIVGRCESAHCLQRLALCNNGLTAHSGDSLARILDTVDTLRELDLSDNRVEADGLKRLARALATDRCLLAKLNLFNNHLGSACAKNISLILKRNRSIRSLNLGKNRLKSKDCMAKIADALCANETLEHLDLSHNKMGDARATQLAPALDPEESACPLKSLDLTGNVLTTAGVEEITGAILHGGNTHLEKLVLSQNDLGLDGANACAKCLQRSHTLQELVLSSCRVGDEGVGLLCQGLKVREFCLSSLRKLDLSWNCIHNSGAMEIAIMLEGDHCLTSLNLANNGIGSAGAQALCLALRSNLPLQELDLTGNQIGNFGAFRLAEFVCHDDYSLQTLKWEENKRMTDAGRARVEAAFRFRRAKAGWLGKTLRDIKTRKRMREMTDLPKLGDEEMMAICQHLSIHRPILPYVSFKSLTGPGAVSHRGIQVLAQTVISQNCIPLNRLHLQNAAMGDLGCAAFSQALLHNQNLTMLSLTSCGITNQGALFLSNIMRRNRILERLDLKKNRIGDRGAQDLFSAISESSHPTMVSLNLSHNLLTDVCFAAMLTFEPVKQVFLENNSVTDRGALDLAKVMLNSPNLQRLHVSGNCMTQRGLQVLNLYCPEDANFQKGIQRPA